MSDVQSVVSVCGVDHVIGVRNGWVPGQAPSPPTSSGYCGFGQRWMSTCSGPKWQSQCVVTPHIAPSLPCNGLRSWVLTWTHHGHSYLSTPLRPGPEVLATVPCCQVLAGFRGNAGQWQGERCVVEVDGELCDLNLSCVMDLGLDSSALSAISVLRPFLYGPITAGPHNRPAHNCIISTHLSHRWPSIGPLTLP